MCVCVALHGLVSWGLPLGSGDRTHAPTASSQGSLMSCQDHLGCFLWRTRKQASCSAVNVSRSFHWHPLGEGVLFLSFCTCVASGRRRRRRRRRQLDDDEKQNKSDSSTPDATAPTPRRGSRTHALELNESCHLLANQYPNVDARAARFLVPNVLQF